MIIVFVGKFIHVVKKNNRRSVFRRFIKHVLNLVDKFSVGLVFAAHERLSAAFFYKTVRHKRFPDARISVKQKSAERRNAESLIFIRIFDYVAKSEKFRFNIFIAYYLVKFTHYNTPLSFYGFIIRQSMRRFRYANIADDNYFPI